MEDDNTRQKDEVEALAAIYGKDFLLENKDCATYSIEINEEGKVAHLQVTFPTNYPSKAPPSFMLSAPWLKGVKKQQLCDQLKELYMYNLGESIVYIWVEEIRRFITDEDSVSEKTLQAIYVPEIISNDASVCLEGTASGVIAVDVPECPKILSGDVISDRKSHFQGHLAHISSIAEVRLVLKTLYENKKIGSATHNISAYRFTPECSSVVFQDCDDDGETHAGNRMLHLLQILKVMNVVVIVSRWYGGINLGADRFKHINNSARQILDACGYIKPKTDGKIVKKSRQKK